jgi:hypothetical protein
MASSASASDPGTGAKTYESIVKRVHPSVDIDICRKPIGKGSFGTVYVGETKAEGLKVAAKFSHNHLSETALNNARDEALIMQQVSVVAELPSPTGAIESFCR